MRLLISLLCAFACLFASTAFGQVRPGATEVGIYAGGWEGDAIFDSAATYGVRGRYDFNALLGLEATIGLVSTEKTGRAADNIAADDALLTQTGLNAVMHLSYSALAPYLSAGIGTIIEDEVHLAGNVAFGATYHVNDLIGVRAEGRGWFSNTAPNTDQFDHFEATLGLSFQFGGNNDIDGDGIVNRLDQCPVTAEDKDGIDDTDGCVEEPAKDKDATDEVKAAAQEATKVLEAPAPPPPPPAPAPAAPEPKKAEPAPAAVVPPAAPASCEETCKKDMSGADLEVCLARCKGETKPEAEEKPEVDGEAPLDAQSDAAEKDMEKAFEKSEK